MKSKFLLLTFLALFPLLTYGTITIVSNSGVTFTPANITITEGDTVQFNIANTHDVVEVSQATHAANGNTPLAGGFSLPFGGGSLLPADLPVGVHYYVCSPHASFGMVGTITVEAAPLGFDITDLSISAEDCGVNVQWTSQKADEVDFFQIAYTEDLNSEYRYSEKIYSSASGIAKFGYTIDLIQGEYFVKIMQQDLSGSSYYTIPERVSLRCNQPLEVYVEAVQSGSISLINTRAGDQVFILDMMGRVVNETLAQGSHSEINVSNLASNMYFLSVHRNGQQLLAESITIEN